MGEEGPQKKELEDVRADFMCNYVCKSMRIKPEKWSKMIHTDELRVSNFCLEDYEIQLKKTRYVQPLVADFLSDDAIKMLVISTNNAGALMPMYEFPASTKSKVVYFIRKKPAPLPKETIRDVSHSFVKLRCINYMI